jgi:hypothetical protein
MHCVLLFCASRVLGSIILALVDSFERGESTSCGFLSVERVAEAFSVFVFQSVSNRQTQAAPESSSCLECCKLYGQDLTWELLL